MARVVDLLAIALLLLALGAFAMGIQALGRRADLESLYWLVVGGLVLKAGVEMLRPRGVR